MAISGVEKLKLIRELGDIRGAVSGAKGVAKLALVKRIGEIRVLLSTKSKDDVEIDIDYGSKIITMSALKSYLATGLASIPEALRSSEAQTVINAYKLAAEGSGVDRGDDIELYNKLRELDSGSVATDALDYFKNQGESFAAKWVDVSILNNEYKNLEMEPVYDDYTDEQRAQLDKLKTKITKLKNTYYNYTEAIDNIKYGHATQDMNTEQQYELRISLYNEQKVVYEEWDAVEKEYMAISNGKLREKNEKLTVIKNTMTEHGADLINNLIELSTITQEQADSWVSKQDISKATANRLTKNGYPIGDVKRDMAEFYRITNGKLKDISLLTTRASRAFATGIGTYTPNEINVTQSFSKRVLWHEMAHHLEGDPIAVKAATGFLIKRRKSEVPKTLQELTGNNSYRSDEIAYEDEFISPYIGKVYWDGVTEVFSMGMEYLSSPDTAAEFLAKDPEMLALITGYIQFKLSPGMVALQKLQGGKVSDNGANSAADDKVYNEYLDKISSEVTLDQDSWFSDIDERHQKYLISGGYYVNDPNAKYIGSWHGYRVFSGKFKTYSSRRMRKGYAVGKFVGAFDVNGTQLYPMIVDLKEVKAAIKFAEVDNNSIQNTFNRYFYYNTDRPAFIKAAKQLLGETNE